MYMSLQWTQNDKLDVNRHIITKCQNEQPLSIDGDIFTHQDQIDGRKNLLPRAAFTILKILKRSKLGGLLGPRTVRVSDVAETE